MLQFIHKNVGIIRLMSIYTPLLSVLKRYRLQIPITPPLCPLPFHAIMIQYHFMEQTFTDRVRTLIKHIPSGKVATYGLIAACAGNPRASRQVVRVLHSSSQKYNLPWHRVINSKGRISLPKGNGYEIQKELLLKEGVVFDQDDTIDLAIFLWKPAQ